MHSWGAIVLNTPRERGGNFKTRRLTKSSSDLLCFTVRNEWIFEVKDELMSSVVLQFWFCYCEIILNHNYDGFFYWSDGFLCYQRFLIVIKRFSLLWDFFYCYDVMRYFLLWCYESFFSLMRISGKVCTNTLKRAIICYALHWALMMM